MSYQDICKGLNKKASAEQVKQLAVMIKQATLQKEALTRGNWFIRQLMRYAPKLARTGQAMSKTTLGKNVAATGAKIKNDISAVPGQFRSGANSAQKTIKGIDPEYGSAYQALVPETNKFNKAVAGAKNVWNNNDTVRKGTKFGLAAGGTLAGASYMKGRGYKQGVKDTADAASSLIGQQNQALANVARAGSEANTALQDVRKKYKEQVGTGFWEGLWALLKRLFTGEGYAQ